MAAVNDRDVRLVAVDSLSAYRIVNEHLTLPCLSGVHDPVKHVACRSDARANGPMPLGVPEGRARYRQCLTARIQPAVA